MIPTLAFGSTGHFSTRTIFGAAALWENPQAEADSVIEQVLEAGVNHFDTAASYGNSELLLGDWIRRHGRPFFLATKTGERTRQGAYDGLRRSLERLHVDQVDMIQLHALHEEADWQQVFGPGGPLEALIQARNEGLVRFIGVTGHGVPVPGFHLRSLEQFDFDAVLLPYNYVMLQNPAYAEPFNRLLELCAQRDIAVQTIKGVTHSPWKDAQQTRNTWYRPLEDQADIDLAVHWILGNPQVFLNTAGDINILPRVLSAAARFKSRPSDQQMQEQA